VHRTLHGGRHEKIHGEMVGAGRNERIGGTRARGMSRKRHGERYWERGVQGLISMAGAWVCVASTASMHITGIVFPI